MANYLNVQGRKKIVTATPWESDFCTMEILYKML